jgi:DNA-binding response OmpR family regulator
LAVQLLKGSEVNSTQGGKLSVEAAYAKKGPVLVIDDEVDLPRTYERLLRRMGCDVITAERGHDGLTIAQARHVALAIVDLKLPDIDGLAVVRALRAAPDPPPVIVVTGFMSAQTRQAGLQAGAADVLGKPFSLLALAALLRNLLGGL